MTVVGTETMDWPEARSVISTGYKLVPWSSWDQWKFVRDSLFSSSPDSVASALRRISAWRSRGCLPVPVDVTAAIVEIQQKDPSFREGAADDVLSSEEMLAMLYCMAITRLVNGFVEPVHKKTGRSISELAEAVGIPRMLVDIRHEGSHRGLPSLRIARLASTKAIDWLRCNYWEPQRKAFPDVRREVKSKLREMTYYLKTRHAQKLRNSQEKRAKRIALMGGRSKLSSLVIGKLQSCKSDASVKQISRISKVIAKLYSVYPSEVVSVLLEYFQLQAPDFSDCNETEDSDSSDDGDLKGSTNYLKIIITKLSSKKPRLLLSVLNAVLNTIEFKESKLSERSELHFSSLQYHAEMEHMKYLCSLIPWLLMNLKAFNDLGQVRLVDETQKLYTDKTAVPKVSLKELLQKCLKLSILGQKHISDSVLLLAKMIGNKSLSMKLKKIPFPDWEDQDVSETLPRVENILLQEEDSITRAAEKLELLKLRLKNRAIKTSAQADGNMKLTNSVWTVAKTWIPCPIGMVPSTSSSSAVLPVLDKACDILETKEIEVKDDKAEVDCDSDMNEVDYDYDTREPARGFESLEKETPSKRLKWTPEEQISDLPETSTPMEGLLLIGGFWKKVTEEELVDLESNIRVFL